MTDSSASDAVLVDRVRQGDAEAFGILVQRYLQAAYAVALSRIGEPAGAEDACQDAFLTALQRIEECRQPDQFGSWLLAIVRNRAHDVRRHRAVRDAAPLEEATAASPAASPLEDAQNAELRQDLLAAMTILTDLQREVLLLYDFEGWSHREIAEKVGISEGSARVHLYNGRRALRARLGKRYKEGA
jgi:RNA polymerase sigma-70 factor, ECF subfamily